MGQGIRLQNLRWHFAGRCGRRSKASETPFPDPKDSANRGDAACSRHRRLGH